MDRITMTRIVDGKKYNTETATLVADDVYWDGHNMERNGTNCWLYKTKNGRYFTVTGTFWQGGQDTLRPVSKEVAKFLYEDALTEHYLTWEEAFDQEPEEA